MPPCYDDPSRTVQVCIVYPGPTLADQITEWVTAVAMFGIALTLVVLAVSLIRGALTRKGPPHDNG